jgi:ferredoxin--NADP+ reductase
MRVSGLLLLLPLCAVESFVIQRSNLGTSSTSLANDLQARVKSAGCGISVYPAGDRRVFDPAFEGLLQGTGECDERISKGASYQYLSPQSQSSVAVEPPVGTEIQDAQHWLEDIGLPQNTYKPKSPTQATVLGRARLISEDAPGDIEHVVLSLPEGMHYVEGQSLSVIPPGTDAKGKPNKPRLYSIASTRYGDLLDGRTVSLCVRRAEYYDPATGLIDPSKKGVCSDFLCNSQPGDVVSVAGPIGKTMLLPEDPTKDIIMVATGTGIAPFRAFLHRLFMENTLARHMFNANAWLILGVPVTGGLLYPDELEAMQLNAEQSGGAASLEVTYAISREMSNAQGGKLYVQDVLAARADELLEKLDQGAVIYFCGLKGMMPGILEALERVATARGIDWSTKLKALQANHQWHVEVY